MSNRKHIFTAGPAVMPVEVLAKLGESVVDYNNSGQSVLELSHRSATFEAIQERADAGLRKLIGLGDEDKILFLQGGATTQFSMVPMNLFSRPDRTGDYISTGTWSEKALKEAKKFGHVNVLATSKDNNFKNIPDVEAADKPAFFTHYTSNNTIYGTQFQDAPSLENTHVVSDMSSDILCRPIDMSKHSLIYAGAQKNLGPSGVTIVIIRGDLYKEIFEHRTGSLPILMDYVTHVEKDSRYNTPPTFAIYGVALVVEWLLAQGGLEAMHERNKRKAAKLYDCIDAHDCYTGVADKGSRSLMNVTFQVADGREAEFIEKAGELGMVGLKGHRSVGGLRASLYNALPEASVDCLVEFMNEFAKA